jgi:predicted TPR repeat methyltransferase
VLATQPRQFDALHLLGVIERQRGNPALAAELITTALQVDPGQPRAHCNLGAALQDLGQPQAALDAYEAALRLDPGYALAWDNRGNTLRRLNRLPDALDSYERALALGSGNPSAWCHRAMVLADLGRHADAVASAEQALALRPAYPDALLVLGNARQALGQLAGAMEAYERALALDGSRADVWCAHGAALKKSGRLEQALASYERALALRPDYAQAEHFRANALRALGRDTEALGAYRRAADLGADAAEIRFALAALGEAETPDAAPQDYVKGLFDQYAGHFDRHLVDVLDYRTPGLLEAVVRPRVDGKLASALDLGCGTGLCGPWLRPLAGRVTGIDLSQRMLDQAATTGLYDELACADIGAWLDGQDGAWDLVVAADVLVYFGALGTLFGQVRRALRPHGLFAFSCEALDDAAGDGYALRPSNRYAHRLDYLHHCAAAAGLSVIEATRGVLRREHGGPVEGHLVLLRLDR